MNETDPSKKTKKVHSSQELHLKKNDILALFIAYFWIFLPPILLFFAIVIGVYLLIWKLA